MTVFNCIPLKTYIRYTHLRTINYSSQMKMWMLYKCGLAIEPRSCSRGPQWCGIFHHHWWTASIKSMLLFSPYSQINILCVEYWTISLFVGVPNFNGCKKEFEVIKKHYTYQTSYFDLNRDNNYFTDTAQVVHYKYFDIRLITR